MQKKFLSIDQQINLLEDRGLTVYDVEKLKWYLTNYNYQNIINGYNDFFMFNNDRKTNIYKKNINSNMIIALFNFDRKISNLLFPNILNIERKFSTLLCFQIIEQNKTKIPLLEMGKILQCSDAELKIIFPKLEFSNESNNLYKKSKNDYETIRSCMHSYSANKKVTKKYKGDIKHVPIWILSVNWSFGDAVQIFSFLDGNTKKKIIEEFLPGLKVKGLNNYFEKIMLLISNVRNIICHNGVLYNIDYQINKGFISRFYLIIFDKTILNIRLDNIIDIIAKLSSVELHTPKKIGSLKDKHIEKLEENIHEETLNHIKKYLDIKR